jgi:hypothetical protein
MFYIGAWRTASFSGGTTNVIIPPSLLLRNEYLTKMGDIGIFLTVPYVNKTYNIDSRPSSSLPVTDSRQALSPFVDFSYRSRYPVPLSVKGRTEFSDRIMFANSASCLVSKAETFSIPFAVNAANSNAEIAVDKVATYSIRGETTLFVTKTKSDDFTAYPSIVNDSMLSYAVEGPSMGGATMVVRSPIVNPYLRYRGRPVSIYVNTSANQTPVSATLEKPSLIFSF